MPTESETRKKIIDFRLKAAGWNVADRTQVIEEFSVSSVGNRGSQKFSDYVLLGKNGKHLAVVEAKKSSTNAELGREQAKQYCYDIQARYGGEAQQGGRLQYHSGVTPFRWTAEGLRTVPLRSESFRS